MWKKIGLYVHLVVEFVVETPMTEVEAVYTVLVREEQHAQCDAKSFLLNLL